MAKVVYNDCFGGYGLSTKACEMLRERGYVYDDYDMCYEVPRHNKDLLEVVEILGPEANTQFSRLKILEVDNYCPAYRIEEYDGKENIITMSSEDWIKID